MGTLAHMLEDGSLGATNMTGNKHKLSAEQKADLEKSILDFFIVAS